MIVAMTRWLTPEEQRTWRAFLAASRALMDTLDRELQRDAGMPHAYYEILVRLSEADEHRLRMSDLADLTGSSRSRLSHAVARLEEAGWVRRENCPSDRRGQFAVLTRKGFETLAGAAPGHVEGVRQHLFDPLSPAQIDQLCRISEVLLDHLVPERPTS
ncbi:MarR family transcriptional regulator [Micromonospora sonneratiae]|uniref:MarR family winged helix-turn-helix transcriptional regulator n=1 Tax=Micromonospora sonneratiae TaxID=1184706 RepID=A0ABW3YCM4_9ACTN